MDLNQRDLRALERFAKHHDDFITPDFGLEELDARTVLKDNRRVTLVFSGVYDCDMGGCAIILMTAAAWEAVCGGHLDVPFEVVCQTAHGYSSPTVITLND